MVNPVLFISDSHRIPKFIAIPEIGITDGTNMEGKFSKIG
jgi:hypothetical protein